MTKQRLEMISSCPAGLKLAARAVRRVPFLFRLQAGLLVTAVCVSFAIGTVHSPKGTQALAFALPAFEEKPTWDQQVEQFALKINRGFRIRRTTAREFSAWLLEAAERQQLAPELLASVVLTESSFRKHVRSHVGAIGPAQVRPELWARYCGSSNLADPAENIYCGAQVLAYYQDICGGELACALHAYNVGPNRKYEERRAKAGRRYVAKVDRHHSVLRNVVL